MTLCALLAIGGMALLLPHQAGAYWPFSPAEADGTSAPILHDASMNLMSAPESTYSDAYFDGYTPDTLDGSVLEPSLSIAGGSTGSSTPIAPEPNSSSAPNSGEISTYTVQEGDNLSSIAAQYGVSMNTILWANDIKDPSTIKPGTKLVILPVNGIEHTVLSGETLSSIAEKFGGDASDIAQFNGISADSQLQAGSTIIIPGGELGSGSGASTKTEPTTSSETTQASAPEKHVSESASTGSSGGGTPECDNTSGNPCHGIDGPVIHGFFTNPLPIDAHVTQGLHGWDAVDLAVPEGTPILAAADGTVILSRMGGWNGGYGNYVILDNGDGVETLYAHMSETDAQVGDTVSAGQTIGYVGMTGDATGDHLHFEVRGAQNPFAFCFEGMYSNDCFDN